MHSSVSNWISSHTPATRAFGLRRWALRRVGLTVSKSARICGGGLVYGNNVTIGDNTWIGWNSRLVSWHSAPITIGANCSIAPEVAFVVGTHEFGPSTGRAGSGRSLPISVGDGTWVGFRATFVAGSSVGSGCMVAAGSVVAGQFGDNLLIAGVPARVVREFGPDDESSESASRDAG